MDRDRPGALPARVAAVPGDVAAFALLTAAVYAVESAVAGHLGGAAHPDALAAAIVVDLALVVPLTFGLLVVRRRDWPWIAVAPWFVLGLAVAGRLLPEARRGPLELAHLAAVPVELAILTWVGRRAWLALRRTRDGARAAGGDFVEAMTESMRPLVGAGRLASIAAYEASVLAYAVGLAPADPGQDRRGCEHFTHHRGSAYPAILGAVSLVALIELVGVHVLLSRLDARLAWAVTLLSVYGAVWVVADLRALGRRPTLIDDDGIRVRLGLRWSVRLAWSDIAALETLDESSAIGARRPLVVSVVGPARLRLRLTRARVASGPYGVTRRVSTIDIAVDDAERFERIVRAKLARTEG